MAEIVTTYQWLIERGQPEGEANAVWLEHSALHPARDRHWTTNAHGAAMFPDREAAEAYIAEACLEARAVEHDFMSFVRPADGDERRALRWLMDVRENGGPLEQRYATTVINTLAWFEQREPVDDRP